MTRPFCTIADMNARLLAPSREGVTKLAEAEGKAKRVPAGALLMSFKLTIGRVRFAAQDLFPNEAIVWIRVTDETEVDERYLALWLGAFDYSMLTGRAAKGNTLNLQSLRTVPVVLPMTDEQRSIAELLTRTDDVADATAATLAAARQLQRALLREHFGSSHDWPMRTLGELGEARSGATPTSGAAKYWDGGTIPYLKSAELRDGDVFGGEHHVTERAVTDYRLRIYPAGTVLIAMYGATRGKLGILRVPATGNQAILAVSPDTTQVSSEYLFYALQAQQEDLIQAGFGGTQKNLSGEFLKRREIPVPPADEQARVVHVLQASAIELGALEASARAIDQTRWAILREVLPVPSRREAEDGERAA